MEDNKKAFELLMKGIKYSNEIANVAHLKDKKALMNIVSLINSDKELVDVFPMEKLQEVIKTSESWDEENDKIYNTPWTKEYVTEFGFEIFRVLLVKEDYKKIRELVAYMKSIGIDDKGKLFPKMLEVADVIENKNEPDVNTLS